MDGLKKENDELIAKNNLVENGSNIERVHVASLESALEEHVKAQSELYEILNLQKHQRRVRKKLVFGSGRQFQFIIRHTSSVGRFCIRRDQEIEG